MVEVARPNSFVPKVVFVDGLFGCGKTMLSPIVSAMPKVEKYTYAYDIEYLCATHFLGKVELDAAKAMTLLMADLQIYNLMMSRECNFRPADLSSVFQNPKKLQYFKRLFNEGGQTIPPLIQKEKPVLNYTTHNLIAFSEPICAALGDKAVFIEVVRHPLYMLKQNTLNMERLILDPADLTVYIRHGDQAVPFYTLGWEEEFLKANPVEKAILYIQKLTDLTERSKATLKSKYNHRIVTLPFEKYVLSPWDYMKEIAEALGSSVDSPTVRAMKRQRVPRKRIADGIPLKIYRYYGWEPAKRRSEREELADRRELAVKQAAPKYLAILDELCARYEKQYHSEDLL